MHTLRVRLRPRPHEAAGIDQRLFAIGQLRNATVCGARKRVKRMRADPRWRQHSQIEDAAERRRAYAALRYEYGIGEKATRELACAHWKASLWMADLLDRRSANALGREVWTTIESWLYSGAGRPRTNHPRERACAWGNDMNGGLRLAAGKPVAGKAVTLASLPGRVVIAGNQPFTYTPGAQEAGASFGLDVHVRAPARPRSRQHRKLETGGDYARDRPRPVSLLGATVL